MLGPSRRTFQAAMALKYCAGSPRQAEATFGWSRRAVELGLHEKRSGVVCLSAQSAFAGDKLWEEKHPDVADALWTLARSHSQQDPTFRSTLSFTRLTAAEALKQLRTQGFDEEALPSASTMAEILNRNGYQLCLSSEDRGRVSLLQIKADNGPESNGRRTQFLKRMVQFADDIGKSIQLLYYPTYHSKYNTVERCWGILEKHWNGAKLTDHETMLAWAKSMTWKGVHPVVELIRKVYEKGISLSKEAMQAVEARLERNPMLPKWDILIRPACTV